MSASERVIRVVVADDHPLFREALSTMIRSAADMELVGEATDGRSALDLVLGLRPDVAVLDVDLGGFDGPDVVAHLAREGASAQVLLVSGQCHGPVVQQALSAGGRGFMTKDAPPRELLDGVRRVAAGEVVLCARSSDALAGNLRAHEAARNPPLSERERDVLTLVAEGLSVADIGARLHISPGTVKAHLQAVYAKLGVSERAAAVAAAMRRNLLR